MKVKVIANYLPQYHRIPENDMWWGEGYTDWVATKNAKPMFEGHRQPRIPLDNNYYDLTNVETIRWQAQLAKQYGVYGFGIYHYWFNSDLQLLQKPAELLLQNKDIGINFMFLWDNCSWRRTWGNIKGNDWAPQFDKSYGRIGNGILAELIYGSEDDWKKHFEYLLPFFKDERYIRIGDKPIFCIMQPQNKKNTIESMKGYWNELAVCNGLKGITILGCNNWRYRETLDDNFAYSYLEPQTFFEALIRKLKYNLLGADEKIQWFDYDKLWKRTLNYATHSHKNLLMLSGMVKFDDTPRRGNKARIVVGSTPQKFQKYFTELLKISKQQGKEYVFCPAWNEWGEGMYLEPDTVDGYAYLEALKAAVDEVNNYKIIGGGNNS